MPGDDMLPGWRAEPHASLGVVFVRQGRTDYETYQVHPIMLATLEPVASPHPLYEDTFPMALGRWFPEEPRLRRLETAMLDHTPIASWTFQAAGDQLELIRCDIGYQPVWIYIHDTRPPHIRAMDQALPAVPQLSSGTFGLAAPTKAAPRLRQAPPVKAFPAQPGYAHLGDATAAEQARQTAIQAEVEAGVVRAAKEAALFRPQAMPPRPKIKFATCSSCTTPTRRPMPKPSTEQRRRISGRQSWTATRLSKPLTTSYWLSSKPLSEKPKPL